jgi:phosphoribosylformylglycinamidine cyclo-ligase
MYQVFNMGHRLEVYLKEKDARAVIDLASAFDIEARIVGHVEDAGTSSVRIESPHGSFEYQN